MLMNLAIKHNVRIQIWLISLVLLCALLLVSHQVKADGDGESLLVTINDVDIPIDYYAADSDSLWLWLPSERGIHKGMKQVAAQLAEQGQAVMLVDTFASWMLAATESNLQQLDTQILAKLVAQVYQQHQRPILLMSHDRGSGVALLTAHAWQQANPTQNYLRGVSLITPNLFVRTPNPGEEGVLLPVAAATSLPVLLLQPELSPTATRMPAIIEQLSAQSAGVFHQRLPAVRDRFFFRPDANEAERQLAQGLPDLLQRSNRLLLQDERVHVAVALPSLSAEELNKERKRGLAVYQGADAQQASDILLFDTQGQQQQLSDLRGNVVLLNFWASWCPPCLHEMPSMQRLQAQLSDHPFAIVAVNLGESVEKITAFVERLELSFPVWLDPDKSSAQAWHVFAYPTTYLLDHLGHIRYAIAGGIEWDEADVVAIVEQLLQEAEDTQ